MNHSMKDTLSILRQTVSLAGRSYEVIIGPGLVRDAARFIAPLLKRPRVAIVTDEAVARHHLGPLTAGLNAAGIETTAKVLPAGETTKSFAFLEEVCEWLIAQEIDRKDMVIALGGGVIGDVTGFASAIVRRGLDFIQIPTTLLSQVDSSVGGKTAINSRRGKNLVGAFHQPRLVLADVAALDTLSPREWRAGYAEVTKYGLLGDADFFAWCESHGAAMLQGDRAALLQAVSRSVAAKAAIVARDERETGDRALLNLGHTFGHALEAHAGYDGRLLHGEAVAIGMVMAFDISARMGLCAPSAAPRVAAHLAAVGLPTHPHKVLPDIDAATMLHHMRQDKKVLAGKLTLILARAIGQAFIAQAVDEKELARHLHDLLSETPL